MRFLNKITFINSATIRYAEVGIDGNVHFIGTQGVGKSTLLRAILFFYNADTLKLGISREKKSFADYYFPYQNAYLIYEITTENGPFSIMAFKSQGKVCFRFIDTAYDKKYFITYEGKAFESWDATRGLLDADRIFYTRKIDRYEEYRDILYGNNETQKEFRKYALLESRQYQNIPRTIQNVFLNSKLEAEFIKQTIIMSLNEEDIEIDLQSYTHHLKDFEAQLTDINLFRQPHILKQAEQVIRFHTAIRHLEREKITLSQQLAYSIYGVQRAQPRLQDKLEQEQAAKSALINRIEESNKRFGSRMLKQQAEISVLEDKLKMVKEKKDYYEKIGIEKLTERVVKKTDLDAQSEGLRRDRDVLRSQFRDVTQKYDLLLQQLEMSHGVYIQSRQTARLESREQLLNYRSEVKEALDKLIADIRQNHQQALQQATVAIEHSALNIQSVRVKKEAVRHQRFLEEELADVSQTINELSLAVQQSRNELNTLKKEQETTHKGWELEEAAGKKNSEREAEKINEGLAQLQQSLSGIEARLLDNKDSLYAWLNENQPGWESSIGKVLDADVLFAKGLAPKKGAGGTLYGVKINLEEISNSVKTVADYEREKKSLETGIEKLEAQLQKGARQAADDAEKLKRKYQPRIKAYKEAISEQTYMAEQHAIKLEQARLAKKDYEIKAQAEKTAALQAVDLQLDAATEAQLAARQALATVEEALQKQIKAKEKEADKKTAAAEEACKRAVKALDAATAAYTDEYNAKKAALDEDQKKELGGHGADTARLAAIEKTLADIAAELKFIEKNRDTVAEYRKDKRELLDKADGFKNEKAVLEQKAENEEQKQKQHIQSFKNEIKAVEATIETLRTALTKAGEDMAAFTDFSVTEAYLSIPPVHKEFKEESKNDRRVKVLVDELNRSYYNSIKRLDELKEAVNKFLSNFSSQNIFSFTTGLIARQQYLDFADSLNDFVADNKIEEFEKRINERFASIIHLLGRETTNLMSKGDEIQKIITSINKDFDRKNFVGAIKKIELRLDESANNIVKLLLQIKKFNDENAYDIGGLNLFSSQDSEVKNKTAVSLLKQLSKSIGEYRRDAISLSDSFELKFRIEENQNDTGWVEKLANVGSEGTDVLVKAMINIMLLNVFKEGASKRFKEFRLHCMMDEIGKLHPNNVKGILQFANDRNILLINGSPVETNAMDYRHIYKLEKDARSFTRVKRIISNYA